METTKMMPRHGPYSGAGQGIGPGARYFWCPREPITYPSIGIRRTRPIERYKSQNCGRPMAVSRVKKSDCSPVGAAPDPGDSSLDSTL